MPNLSLCTPEIMAASYTDAIYLLVSQELGS